MIALLTFLYWGTLAMLIVVLIFLDQDTLATLIAVLTFLYQGVLATWDKMLGLGGIELLVRDFLENNQHCTAWDSSKGIGLCNAIESLSNLEGLMLVQSGLHLACETDQKFNMATWTI